MVIKFYHQRMYVGSDDTEATTAVLLLCSMLLGLLLAGDDVDYDGLLCCFTTLKHNTKKANGIYDKQLARNSAQRRPVVCVCRTKTMIYYKTQCSSGLRVGSLRYGTSRWYKGANAQVASTWCLRLMWCYASGLHACKQGTWYVCLELMRNESGSICYRDA